MTAPNPGAGPARLPDVLLLDTETRPYAWGSPTAIPALRGEEPTGEPVAELWVGAHPGAPSRWRPERGSGQEPVHLGLDTLVAADPDGLLGPAVASAFERRLPFLLKLLAARQALSLQVHPDLVQAREGFARENALGVPIGSATRNYQDDNHKPELLCALTPFDALCGFRDPAATVELLRALGSPRLVMLAERVGSSADLLAPVRFLLDLPPAEASEWVAEAAAAAARCDDERWAPEAGWAVRLAEQSPGEIGPVVALLLNLVRLRPGEAVFLAAGQIHAYLEGFGVEILANSDNVLRCGLTPKHVDAAELLAIATFEPSTADPWPAREVPGGTVYPVPVDDFELSRLELSAASRPVTSPGPQLLLATAGEVVVSGSGDELTLPPGHAAFVPAGRAVAVRGPGTVFRATAGPRVVG